MSKSKKDREMSAEEELRVTNEIEKLKLSAFHGAEFHSKGDVPPEIENQWLEHIKQFEEQFENAKTITIAEKIGFPDFPPVDSLSAKDLDTKLDELIELLALNEIAVEAIMEVSDYEMYRFITEDLFSHETDDIQIPGMWTHFIYEEFYPNDELDINHSIDHFFGGLFSKDFQEIAFTQLNKQCKSLDGREISKDEAIAKLQDYVNLFDDISDVELNDLMVSVDEKKDKATAKLSLSYIAISGKNKTKFDGFVNAELIKDDYGYWNIYSISFPGFQL